MKRRGDTLTRGKRRIIVAGVDGCRGGWACFTVNLKTRKTGLGIYPTFAAVLSQTPRVKVFAVDIPIGLAEKGSRACDQAARKLLGQPRGSSVFPSPVRAALLAKTYEEACRLSRRAHGKALSRQTDAIRPKIGEVDELMTPERQQWIFEVHPEVSFWALRDGKPMKHKKSSKKGRRERLNLLLRYYPDLQGLLGGLDSKQAAPDDLLDAAAAAWTAERIADGSASSVLEEFDARGLRMDIVY
jgi:predicted RNase H-like nuclease